MQHIQFIRFFAISLVSLLFLSKTVCAQTAEQYFLIKAGKFYDSEKNLFLKIGDKLDIPSGTTILDYGDATVAPDRKGTFIIGLQT